MAESPSQTHFGSRPSEVVASFTTYDDAQRAVAFLAERQFPVEDVAIVAGDLRFVEQVTGRRGYWDAAVDGAAAGAATGALMGFVLGLFTLITPLVSGLALALWGLLIGAIVGALIGLIAHAVPRTRNGFTSTSRLDAARYDVVAVSAVAERARQLLRDFPRLRAA